MPSVPRVRHWSCPDPLLLSECGGGPTAAAPWEAEDLLGVAWSPPRPRLPTELPRWAERVLEWREGRGAQRNRRLALVARLTAAARSLLNTTSQTDNDADIEEIIAGKFNGLWPNRNYVNESVVSTK